MTMTINGTSGLVFNDASTQNTAATGFGFKNRIINGAMMIDQRNAGASVNTTAVLAATYTIDRFAYVVTQASKFTIQQNAGSVTPPTGFTNYLGITSSSAYSVTSTDAFLITQNIEGFNVADLGWGTANASTVTLSFWVRSSLTGTFGGAVVNGANNRSYVFSYTINAANTWEQKSVTIAGDTSGTWVTNNGVGLRIRFGLGSGSTFTGTAGAWGAGDLVQPTGSVSVVGTSGATFYITGVQLEKGSTATSFDYRPYGTELQLCERYYSKQSTTGSGGGQGDFASGLQTNTTSGVAYIKFSTKMRASPTVTFSNILATDHNSYQTAATLGSIGQGFDATYLAYNFSASGAQYRPQLLAVNSNTLGYIDFSAEL